jgi:TolB-like protein
MKTNTIIIVFILLCNCVFSQTQKVAILDFENISGKEDYNGLGKALSTMLITDLKNNIHPKKIEFFERSQLNNLLEEQKLQKSKNFDPKTAVNFGKLSGVNFVFVGSIFILDGNCNFSAKMIDVETSKIILSKNVSGRIETWLELKSQLADAISLQLNNPIKIDPAYKKPTISLVTINQYAKVLNAIDQGDAIKAEQLRVLFEETTPDFKYFSDLKDNIQSLKQRVTELENVTDVLTDVFELGIKAEKKADYKNIIKYFDKYVNNPGDKGYVENKKLYAFAMMSISYFHLGDYENAIKHARNASNIYPFYPKSNEIELMGLIKLHKNDEARQKYKFIIDSLTFDNELKFQRQNKNNLLIWEIIYSFYYGLRTQIDSKDLCYSGIREAGYGSTIENEIRINSLLQEDAIYRKFLNQNLSKYEIIEKKLLSIDDSRVFSSNQLVNFFALSYDFSLKLFNQKDYDKYTKHLEKEIRRMESFGIPNKYGNSNGDERTPIPESYVKNPEYDKINQTIFECGLENSLQAFYKDLPLIYGKFVFNYLIQLIRDEKLTDASKLYRSLLTTNISNRESYFYNYEWDVILGLRVVTDDFYSRRNLSKEEQTKRLNKKIEDQLKKFNIPFDNFEKVKNEKNLK